MGVHVRPKDDNCAYSGDLEGIPTLSRIIHSLVPPVIILATPIRKASGCILDSVISVHPNR